MRRPALALVAAPLLLAGCISVFPKTPPAQLYAFGLTPTGGGEGAAAAPPGSAASQVGVVLQGVSLPRAEAGDGILTFTGNQAAYIGGARWTAPAPSLFQDALERAFEARARRVRLLHRGDIAKAGALLRLDGRSFEARYASPGAPPTVVIVMRARLSRPDGSILDERTFAARQPAAENRAGAVVQAFDAAAGQVIADVAAWTEAAVPPAR